MSIGRGQALLNLPSQKYSNETKQYDIFFKRFICMIYVYKPLISLRIISSR